MKKLDGWSQFGASNSPNASSQTLGGSHRGLLNYSVVDTTFFPILEHLIFHPMHINSKSNFLAFYHVIFGIPLFGAICDASTARIGNFTCDGLVPRVRRRMAECDLADRKSREICSSKGSGQPEEIPPMEKRIGGSVKFTAMVTAACNTQPAQKRGSPCAPVCCLAARGA